LVIAISTTLGARSGLLVRDRRGLEEARSLDVVVFDKTGTLTQGEFGIAGLTTIDGVSADDALRLTAAAEADSEHPIAQAIVQGACARGRSVPGAESIEALSGRGMRAVVGGRRLYAGGPALLRSLDVEPPPGVREAAAAAARNAQTVVYLLEERTPGTEHVE